MNKSAIILIGHKARQGKDYLAKEMEKYANRYYGEKINIEIIHFADVLKKEVEYDANVPLIIYDKDHFLLRESIVGAKYRILKDKKLPSLIKYMNDRNAKLYYGMKEKDGNLLQIWGTDYRRKIINNSYWVDKVNKKIMKILSKSNVPVIIVIPDTRFNNELKNVYKGNILTYIDISRYKDDGNRYLDTERDNSHYSETELDWIEEANNIKEVELIKLSFKSGETDLIKKAAKEIIKEKINILINEG